MPLRLITLFIVRRWHCQKRPFLGMLARRRPLDRRGPRLWRSGPYGLPTLLTGRRDAPQETRR
jgi:hypothetical protein